MSQIPGNNAGGQGGGNSGGGNAPAPNPAMMRRRPASVQLRAGQSGSDVSSLMDPANQSLAEALKITYRIIQLTMLGLVVAYAASGFQSVKTTETGIRVTLGEAESQPVPPGFAFSLPAPLGEVVKIDTSAQTMDMDRQFFQGVREEDRRKAVTELEGQAKFRLDPIADGHNLMGDLSIGHTRWKVQYQRSANGVLDYARNINPQSEWLLVNRAVMRGVVQAVAQVSIDELLKDQPDAERKGPMPLVQSLAREIAQKTLDENRSGIVISNLDMDTRTPPLNLRRDFATVDSSKAEARREVESAEQERRTKMANTAGEAADDLLKLVREFETHLSAGDRAQADATLETLNGILDGSKPTPGGKMLAGQASATIKEAQSYRSGVARRAAADAELYKAKQAIYRTNPKLLVTGDWAEAYQQMMSRGEKVVVWYVPPGALDLWLNTDPEIARLREMKLLEDRRMQIGKQEMKTIQDGKFNTLTTPSKEVKSQ